MLNFSSTNYFMEVKDNNFLYENENPIYINNSDIDLWRKQIEDKNKDLPYFNRTKLVKCIDCNKWIEVNICTPDESVRCPECKKLHQKLNRQKRELKKKEEYKLNGPYTCLTCDKEFIEDYRKSATVKQGPPRFCCRECANKYASHHLDQTRTKLLECTICHELKEANIHCSSDGFVCETCKNLKKEQEKISKKNNENSILHIPYRYSEDCILGKFERSQSYKSKSINLQRLGFNFENPNWEEEFFKIRNMLYDLYYKEESSALMLSNKFDLCLSTNIKYYLNLFGFFKTRNLSEAVRLAYKKDRLTVPINTKNYIYNQGWYKLKTGEEYFYRSNYELWMMQFLEARGVKFTLNQFHISYMSSEDGKEHNGYPDFYLPDYNVLIETKGEDKYDEQNLIDRYETAIKPKGMDFIVIGCYAKYLNDKEHCQFRKWFVLKSFIEDSSKEKALYDLLEIK